MQLPRVRSAVRDQRRRKVEGVYPHPSLVKIDMYCPLLEIKKLAKPANTT